MDIHKKAQIIAKVMKRSKYNRLTEQDIAAGKLDGVIALHKNIYK